MESMRGQVREAGGLSQQLESFRNNISQSFMAPEISVRELRSKIKPYIQENEIARVMHLPDGGLREKALEAMKTLKEALEPEEIKDSITGEVISQEDLSSMLQVFFEVGPEQLTEDNFYTLMGEEFSVNRENLENSSKNGFSKQVSDSIAQLQEAPVELYKTISTFCALLDDLFTIGELNGTSEKFIIDENINTVLQPLFKTAQESLQALQSGASDCIKDCLNFLKPFVESSSTLRGFIENMIGKTIREHNLAEQLGLKTE